MTKSEYAKKFQDPKWQEKRLRIFERDGFKCQYWRCESDPSTQLHVHHRYYRWGADPWDYPDDALVTLCADCHEKEGIWRDHAQQQLIEAAMGGVPAVAVYQFALALQRAREQEHNPPWAIISAVEWLLNDEGATRQLVEEYLKRGVRD